MEIRSLSGALNCPQRAVEPRQSSFAALRSRHARPARLVQESTSQQDHVYGSRRTPLRRVAQMKSRIEVAYAQEKVSLEDSAALLDTIVAPVRADMKQLTNNLRHIVGERHPMLMAAADQIFGAGGKQLRPLICLLIARATSEMMGLRDITERHRRLAEVTEMIHTASLVHDDVLDDCDVRRGKRSVNSLYGTRIAVLVGDFLFAQSSWFLASLDNLEVIKLISQVIADFANGEISQASSLFNTNIKLEEYLDKSFYKTASLIAASCRSEAVFSECSESVKLAMYDYGKYLGLAFQVVDDILDFTQSSEQLGKPQGQDLASGNLTAPAIFAMRRNPALVELIEGEFEEEGDLEQAVKLVIEGGGVEDARALALQHAEKARQALTCLPECPSKRSLHLMVDYVLRRVY